MAKFRPKQTMTPKCPLLLRNIVETLFPRQPNNTSGQDSTGTSEAELVSLDELIAISGTLNEKKTPGPDNIPKKELKIAIHTKTKIFNILFDACLL